MSAPARTPTPWTHWSAHKEGMLYSVSLGAEGATHSETPAVAYGATPEEAEANAAFIVRAVNAHDDLLAICKAIRGAYDGDLTAATLQKLDAAIAKAEARP